MVIGNIQGNKGSITEPVVTTNASNTMTEAAQPADDSTDVPTSTASAPTTKIEKPNDTTDAPPTTATAAKADNAPCRTLYLRGLDEKRKAAVIRQLLHAMFSAYGEIEWISCHRAVALRGQAFITFADVETATNAMRRLQGVGFLERPLQIAYARTETLRPKGKKAVKQPRPRPEPTSEPKPKRMKSNPKLAPNRILFAQQVSNVKILSERCARFAGFVEVRPVPAKPAIAFVEFVTEQHAAVAVAALHGTAIEPNTEPLQLAYAKK